MKVIIFSLVVAITVLPVLGGSLFDEKEETKEAVGKKYDETITHASNIKNDIEAEKKKKDENLKSSTKTQIQNKHNNILKELEEKAIEVTKTAIAKGKPIQAIECIGNTWTDGTTLFKTTNEQSLKMVDEVEEKKVQRLNLLNVQVDFIQKGLTGLRKQSLSKIENSKVGFEALKTDAFKKADSANKQLQEIEHQITKPLLSDEYKALRTQAENKFKEIQSNLYKRLLKCVA